MMNGKRWTIALISGVALVLFLRSPYLVINPTLWSEDGIIFFQDAYSNGIVSVAHPYAGYLHVTTRFLAWLAVTFFPLDYLPTIFLSISLLATLFTCYLYCSSRILGRVVGAIGALALILVPHNGEVFFSLTNIHWILSALYPLLLLEPPLLSKKRLVGRCLILLLLGLNDPHICITFPIFCWRLLKNRNNRLEMGYFLVAAICFAIQATVIMVADHSMSHLPDCPKEKLAIYWILALFAQPMAMFILGQPLARLALHNPSIFVVGGMIVVGCLSLLCLSFLKSLSEHRKSALFWLLLGSMFFLSSTYRFLNAPYGLLLFGASRYFYLPYVFMVVSISIVSVRGGWLNKVIGIVVLIATLAGSLSDYRVPNRMSVHWKDRMLELKKTGKTLIKISPGDDWTLNLKSK